MDRRRAATAKGPNDRSGRGMLVAVRLFVAVWPSPEVVDAVASLPRPGGGTGARAAPQSGGTGARAAPQSGGTGARAAPQSGGTGARWTGPEQWHVTLRFLGEVSDEEAGEVEAGLAEVAARLGPALAVVGPATACFGTSVLMVPVSGLEAVAAATVEATAGWGAAPPDRRPFVGHLTLARSRRRGPDLRRFAGQPLAASWTASEFTLVRSSTARTGARYEVLRRFALSG